MDCCVFSSDHDAAEFYDQRTRIARKPHACCECREVIPVGTKYEYVSGMWDGEISVYKTCLSCVELRDHFAKACNGSWVFTELWPSLEENFFPDMRAGGPCMKGLSPAAKARLFERRLKWQEDSA